MGDRCYLQITCRKSDQERFSDLLDAHESTDADPTVRMSVDEANYGYMTMDGDSGELPNDVPYIGFHGAGGNYGQGKFACDGTTFRYVECTDYGYAIAFDGDGNPDVEALAAVREYLAFEKRVRAMLKAPSEITQVG